MEEKHVDQMARIGKMGKMERRALDAMAALKRWGELSFSVEWARSATWGYCPRIMWNGEKAAHASGCGYDKLSAVVAGFLGSLSEDIAGKGGAGIYSVIEACAKAGWRLEHTYNGKIEDGFRISKIEEDKAK